MLTNQKLLGNRLALFMMCLGVLFTFVFCKKEAETKQVVDAPELKEPFTFPRSTPEDQGVESQSIVKLINEIGKSEIQFHSIMIVRHGHVIAEGWWEPYKPEYKHQLYSLSKSFTSTGIGLAVKEGLLSVNDKVVSFFPEDLPEEVSANLAALTIKDLLTMSVGHNEVPMNKMRENEGTSWVKTFLAAPIENEPGTKFLYNTSATFMLSAIIQKVTGEKLIDFLKPRLFVPLNITDADWLESPGGINTGGYGLRVKTEDIAKLGQLYLQKGKWEDQQILTEQWVVDATKKQIDSKPSADEYEADNDWAQGYGYQFWRNSSEGFRADGAFGQFSIVIPEKDMVVAITGESFNMADSMKLIWKNLLPGVKEGALPYDMITEVEFTQAMKNLIIGSPIMEDTSSIIDKISKKQYVFEEDNELGVETMFFSFNEEGVCTLIINDESGSTEVNCGVNKWIVDNNKKKDAKSLFPVPGRLDFPSKMAANAIWLDDTNLQCTWRFLENVHGDRITFKFEGDDYEKVTLTFMNSVSEGKEQKDPRKPLVATIGKVKIDRAL